MAKFKYLVNSLLFYFLWFYTVAEVANHHPFHGVIAIGILCLFYIFYMTNDKLAAMRNLLIYGAIGTAIDTAFLNFGLIEYREGYLDVPFLAPLWITFLWIFFGYVVDEMLIWMRKYLWLAALCGAIGGPLSYQAAFKLDAATSLQSLWITFGIIGAVWVVLFPLLLLISSSNKGMLPSIVPNIDEENKN